MESPYQHGDFASDPLIVYPDLVLTLVPGGWSVRRWHDTVEAIEQDLRSLFTDVTVTAHLEPIEDPVSWQDTGLDR